MSVEEMKAEYHHAIARRDEALAGSLYWQLRDAGVSDEELIELRADAGGLSPGLRSALHQSSPVYVTLEVRVLVRGYDAPSPEVQAFLDGRADGAYIVTGEEGFAPHLDIVAARRRQSSD